MKNRNNLNKFFNEVDSNIEKLMKEEIENLSDQLKVITPVKTGNLKDSWQKVVKVNSLRYRLINNADYAYNVLVLGTSSQLRDGILPVIYSWQASINK